jgi:MerR HTH family regulatory protein
MLTLTEITEQLGVHHHTIKAWRRAGLLTSRQANDRNEQLYDPPQPRDPRLVKQLGQRLADRELIQTGPGVHYETNALSKQSPTLPIEASAR